MQDDLRKMGLLGRFLAGGFSYKSMVGHKLSHQNLFLVPDTINIFKLPISDIWIFLKYGMTKKHIRIEASSICQLRCVGCSQSTGDLGIYGKGYLKSVDFKSFVDRYPMFKNIELSNNGEIFTNPDLIDILKYAHKKQITLTAYNGVNFNNVSDEVLESLVRFRFSALVISLDGASQNTYKIYRRGGNFDNVIKNIEKLNDIKQRLRIEFPTLIWQFIPFGHNEHEISKAKQMAKTLNMGFRTQLNTLPELFPIKKEAVVRQESGLNAATVDEYEARTKVIYNYACLQLWESPQINWDGKLLGCCWNRYSDFGNVFESDLAQCIKSEKYTYAKKMVLGISKPRKDIPCTNCPIYEKIPKKYEQEPQEPNDSQEIR